MKLLTFLGMADLKQTTYVLDEKRHASCYCAAALVHFFRPETVLMVATAAARGKHFEPLAREIEPLTKPVAVPIPDGHSEADLWTIFDALTGQVDEGETLIVDLTNGFRSLPFLSFLAVAYLRVAKKVDVQGVYYGAWEARDLETNATPVFDLTPFVTLLDWSIATDRFERLGDAGDLAGLLRADMPPGLLMGRDMEARDLGKGLQSAAEVMEMTSLALRVNRPYESMEASRELVETLEEHRTIIEGKSRPFAVLTDHIEDAYRPFALQDPLDKANWRTNLSIQLDMIGWYLDKAQVIQAVTLAREWLVSLLVYRLGGDSMVKYKGEREFIEHALNNAAEKLRPKAERRSPLPTNLDDALSALPQSRELAEVWNQLSDLRNDLAHVAGRRPARKVLRDTEQLYEQLRSVGQVLLIDEESTP